VSSIRSGSVPQRVRCAGVLRGVPFLYLVAQGALAAAGLAAVAPASPEAQIEVVATRIAEDPRKLSASVTVIDGQDLRNRGASDLRSALALVAGVDIAPGGDNGPAAAVPEMWGLREFDAFLLVVDDVPWGGAFNPDVATLSLKDVARIEILRGAAPVMYGATSFVGVIHVVHAAPGTGGTRVSASAGSYSSGGIGTALDLPSWAGFSSRLVLDAEQHGLSDDRADFQRTHLAWRNLRDAAGGKLRLDFDLSRLEQSPVSPVPRQGPTLSPLVPLDANYNPRGAHIDPTRATLTTGFSRPASFGSWSMIASYARTETQVERGFLTDLGSPEFSAQGLRTQTTLDDLYVDGHVEYQAWSTVEVVAGADYLFGRGSSHGGNYDYSVAADGSQAPRAGSIPLASAVQIDDRRSFGGAYAAATWQPAVRWRFDAGVRLNVVSESRRTAAQESGSSVEKGGDERSTTRPSGSLGAVYTFWSDGADDARLFVSYRNTFKPAAVDFGLDAEPGILEPETGQSVELGARTALFERRLEVEIDAFQMDLKNLVVPTTVDGMPALENAGEERFRGIEAEVRGHLAGNLLARAAWSLHDARFLDYVRDFDGVATQLSGNRQEMTPRDLAAVGLVWAAPQGLTAHADLRYTGARYLNKRNTALVPGFTSWSAGLGWRAANWELRLDGENLSDRRDPIAESEMADASYYRLEARRVWLSVEWRM